MTEVGCYVLLRTLKVNGLNFLGREYRVTERMRTQTQLYATSKMLTSDTH